MKIISIIPNAESKKITIGGTEFQGVILTTKNCLGFTKKIKLYPSNYGRTGGDGNILYYYFVDELGKEIDSEVSQQITNFFWVQTLKVKS